MDIIDNFGLPSKQREGFNPWLENILDMINESCVDKKATLRLTGNRTNNTIVYSLRNSQNKTQADLYKRNKVYHVDLYKRDLPDMRKAIKPENVLVASFVFKKGDVVELAKMAELVTGLVVADTPYSLGTVNKIKVSPVSLPHATLIGGQITGIEYKEDDVVNITVENGKASYTVRTCEFGESRLNPLKYIVFGLHGEVTLINSPEFEFYYEMI